MMSVMLVSQASIEEMMSLYFEVVTLARRPDSPKKTKFIGVVLECNFVELVQKMWRRYLRPELIEKDEDLPTHLNSSLSVIHFFHF